MIEIAARQWIDAVIGASGIGHVGHQHGVVVRRDFDAAQREDLPVELEVLTDLDHAEIFKERLHCLKRIRFGDLIGGDLALEQAASAVAALTMRQRHVAGLVRRDREGEAAKLRLHRIEAVGFDIEREKTEVARPFDPRPQPFETAHGFIFRAVEFLPVAGILSLPV